MNSINSNDIPPVMPSMYFGNGKFEFITSKYDREMLIGAHQVITNLELWNWMRHHKPDHNSGYMFWTHPNMGRIMSELDKGPVGHSGSSFAITMRHMEYIADHGYDAYMLKIVANVDLTSSNMGKNPYD